MVKEQLRRDARSAEIQPATTRSRKCCRPRRRLSRAQVLKMLSQKQAEADGGRQGDGCGNGAVSPGGTSIGEASKEFLSTGRTGRRNALPDILGQHAETDTADLPSRLEALTTKPKHDQPSTSGISQDGASMSQQHTG